MKKLIVFAAVMLLAVSAFAQREVGSVTIQPKIGMNIASMTDSEDLDSRIGLVVGGEMEYQITDLVSLSVGALYSMQGCKGTVEYSVNGKVTTIGDATLKLDYINVPVLANVYVAKGLAVKLGIQPGFKINSEVSAKTAGVKVEAEMPGAQSVDLAIPVGLSYEFSNFQVDARYNWGVTDAYKWGGETKNSVFQITVGYKFDLHNF